MSCKIDYKNIEVSGHAISVRDAIFPTFPDFLSVQCENELHFYNLLNHYFHV